MAKQPANDYGVKHADDCASGDRAEVRGECDCGAVDARPWKLRIERPAKAENERPTVHVVTHRELTLRELTDLALSALELTRIEGERWGQGECRRLEREAKKLRALKDAECFCGELASVDRPCKVCKANETPFDSSGVASNTAAMVRAMKDEDEERPPWET